MSPITSVGQGYGMLGEQDWQSTGVRERPGNINVRQALDCLYNGCRKIQSNTSGGPNPLACIPDIDGVYTYGCGTYEEYEWNYNSMGCPPGCESYCASWALNHTWCDCVEYAGGSNCGVCNEQTGACTCYFTDCDYGY